jgi:hypothetical protein
MGRESSEKLIHQDQSAVSCVGSYVMLRVTFCIDCSEYSNSLDTVLTPNAEQLIKMSRSKNMCENQQIHQIFIQFSNYVW